jgi:hypothetical protein
MSIGAECAQKRFQSHLINNLMTGCDFGVNLHPGTLGHGQGGKIGK